MSISKDEQLKKNRPLKTKKCKFSKCQKEFVPVNGKHICCDWKCATDYAKEKAEKTRASDQRKARKEYKQMMKVAQQVVNKYVRLRDRNESCISCNSPSGFRIEAGHYRSAGNNGAIRFHTLNIHAQDHKCNCHLSANLIPYRENLIKKIGLNRVEWLEAQTQTRKYTVEYLQRIIKVFRKKNKLIESKI